MNILDEGKGVKYQHEYFCGKENGLVWLKPRVHEMKQENNHKISDRQENSFNVRLHNMYFILYPKWRS